jgi:5-formyltetrahydrofolate cyclo-ligase
MISEEKQMLRLRVLESLRAMTPEERAEKSAAISTILVERLGKTPGVVFGFAPLRLEPDWLIGGYEWNVAFPRIDGTRMHFHRSSDFVRGPFGAREPAGGELVALDQASAVFVPGLAFDRAGARLGRGGGFYDRLLSDPAFTAPRIGICFAGQLVAHVPVEPHDAGVDAIVTEEEWIDVRNNGLDRD